MHVKRKDFLGRLRCMARMGEVDNRHAYTDVDWTNCRSSVATVGNRVSVNFLLFLIFLVLGSVNENRYERNRTHSGDD